MKLGDEKKKKILKNLEDKWPPQRRVCPICNNNKFEMPGNIFQISQYFPTKLIVGPIVPLIVVTCTNCGYTLLFNALTLQAIKRKPIFKDQKDESE
jgi:predicted nucleic-acid-binding Zn-ribbon protein